MNAHGWCFDEFRYANFGDERLFERFMTTAHALAGHPERSIRHACGSWAAAKAAYRMFNNEKVSAMEILESHQIAAAKRIANEKIIFSLQDTTFLDFESHPKTQGLGSIGKAYSIKDKLGLILHPSLAVNEQGLPLGLLSLQCWARPIKEKRSRAEKSAEHSRTSIYDKESAKWLHAFQNTERQVPETTRLITIADREADIYELMGDCYKYKRGFVIRSRINRKLDNSKYRKDKMWEYLARKPLAGIVEIEINDKVTRKKRIARCEIRYGKFTVPLNVHLRWGSKKRRAVDLPNEIFFNAVSIKEINQPETGNVDWTLVTSEEVGDLATAIRIVEWYKLRWQIELYFRILKSGCKVEECRLENADALKRYITLMSVVAFRIFSLEKLAREKPDDPCSEILSSTEWKTLHCRANRTKTPPANEPSIHEAVVMIARLGGFLARKNDGFPGAMTIWRGWQELQTIVEFWEIMQPTGPPS